MGTPVDKVRVLLRDSMIQICHSQLTFYSHLLIKGQVEVTVDNQDTHSVYINEMLQKQVTSSKSPPGGDQVTDGCHTSGMEKDVCQSDTPDKGGTFIKQETEHSLTGLPWDSRTSQPSKRQVTTDVSMSRYSEWIDDGSQMTDVSSNLEVRGMLIDSKESRVSITVHPSHSNSGQQADEHGKVQVETVADLQLPSAYQLQNQLLHVQLSAQVSDGEDAGETDDVDASDNANYKPDDVELEVHMEEVSATEDVPPTEDLPDASFFTQEVVQALTGTRRLPKEDGFYRCPQCEFVTEHGTAMITHIKVHERNFPCEHCEEMFSCDSIMRQHMSTEHGIANRRRQKNHKRIMCKICEIEFSCAEDLSLHNVTEHDSAKVGESETRMLECRLCAGRFERGVELLAHMQGEHECRAGICPYCDYVSAHPGNLQRHIRKHKNMEGKMQCKLCDAKCIDRLELKLHVEQQHTPGGAVVCDMCGEVVSGPVMLKKHIKTVHQVNSCHGCNFSSARLQVLEKHQRVGKEKLVCGLCSRDDFVCVTQMRKHVGQEHPMDHKKKRCEFCGKVFCSRQGLYTHRKVIHGGELNEAKHEVFTCHICGKSFPIIKYLKGHMRSHDTMEPYKCPKCHKTFKYHRNFKSHKQGCINTSGYPCPICNKTLKNEYSVKIHMKGVHLSDKAGNYPCRKCAMPFSHIMTRTSHEKLCSLITISTAMA